MSLPEQEWDSWVGYLNVSGPDPAEGDLCLETRADRHWNMDGSCYCGSEDCPSRRSLEGPRIQQLVEHLGLVPVCEDPGEAE